MPSGTSWARQAWLPRLRWLLPWSCFSARCSEGRIPARCGDGGRAQGLAGAAWQRAEAARQADVPTGCAVTSPALLVPHQSAPRTQNSNIPTVPVALRPCPPCPAPGSPLTTKEINEISKKNPKKPLREAEPAARPAHGCFPAWGEGPGTPPGRLAALQLVIDRASIAPRHRWGGQAGTNPAPAHLPGLPRLLKTAGGTPGRNPAEEIAEGIQ